MSRYVDVTRPDGREDRIVLLIEDVPALHIMDEYQWDNLRESYPHDVLIFATPEEFDIIDAHDPDIQVREVVVFGTDTDERIRMAHYRSTPNEHGGIPLSSAL